MLHKKFKPSKCKTALNLAKSRIKLLKNRKDMQVKQLRRELAQLLQSGQDQTARIRVEHVVREEKMMAAFELIEIYCELVVARLPILESQNGNYGLGKYDWQRLLDLTYSPTTDEADFV